MARMDIRKARALAEQMIMSGQNDGLTREDLVQQIIAKAEGAGAPGTAIGAALAPVTLTPAATAPMQPGVPLRAPKPTTEMLPQPQEQELPVAPQRAAPLSSRYRPMLNAALADIAAAQDAMAGQKPDKMAQIRIEALRSKAQQLQDLVQAEESPEAEIPEEMRAAMEGRQARLARREELLGEQQARAPFAALLAAGAAGAQGRRGETDVEAITRILQAGFGGYDQSRRGFEEGTENIAEARDQAMIDRYNMQEKAREAARQRALEVIGIGEKAEDRAVRDVETPLRLRKGEADVGMAEFNLKNAPEMARLDRLVALARINASNREGGGEGKVDVEKRMATQALQGVADEYEGARTLYNEEIRAINADEKNKEKTPEEKVELVTPEVRNAYIKAKAILESRSRAYDRIYGSSPFIKGQGAGVSAPKKTAGPPVAGARLAPDGKYYVPDPKRPGKYLQVG